MRQVMPVMDIWAQALLATQVDNHITAQALPNADLLAVALEAAAGAAVIVMAAVRVSVDEAAKEALVSAGKGAKAAHPGEAMEAMAATLQSVEAGEHQFRP